MKKKQIWAFIIAAVVFTAVGVSSVFAHRISNSAFTETVGTILSDSTKFSPPDDNYIAVVNVTGTIQPQSSNNGLFDSPSGYRHNTTMEYIDELIKDENNSAILLYIDSPGGTVYESEELYDKLRLYSEETERPIWTYMAHTAASGGYMASVASDYIFANKNTVTGSIGVIMSGYDMSGLYEKLGIRYISITSGKNKDSSAMTEEQISIYQSQVDECYEAFTSKVASGRKMDIEKVKELADGRTYTATQALDNGLIDEISSYDAMREKMSSTLKTDVFYEPSTETNFITDLFSHIQNLIPKSESQVLLETANELESGVLMYYAEQY